MSVSVFAIYRAPEDKAAFDKSYFEGHVPIVADWPGVKEIRAHKVTQPLAGSPELHVLTEIVFDSKEDAMAALGSDPGKESAKDLASWGGDKLITLMLAEPVDL